MMLLMEGKSTRSASSNYINKKLSKLLSSETLPPTGHGSAHARADHAAEGVGLSRVGTVKFLSLFLLNGRCLLVKFAVDMAVLHQLALPQLLLFLSFTYSLP